MGISISILTDHWISLGENGFSGKGVNHFSRIDTQQLGDANSIGRIWNFTSVHIAWTKGKNAENVSNVNILFTESWTKCEINFLLMTTPLKETFPRCKRAARTRRMSEISGSVKSRTFMADRISANSLASFLPWHVVLLPCNMFKKK